MKTLDLNQMGLTQLSANEMTEMEGGRMLAAIIVGLIGAAAIIATNGAALEGAIFCTMAAYAW